MKAIEKIQKEAKSLFDKVLIPISLDTKGPIQQKDSADIQQSTWITYNETSSKEEFYNNKSLYDNSKEINEIVNKLFEDWKVCSIEDKERLFDLVIPIIKLAQKYKDIEISSDETISEFIYMMY